MKETKFVAFSTQKGGAGKTTLTVVMASYFYYIKGMKVLVVDCDYPQYSIEEMRQRDKDLVDCNPAFEKAFRENIVRTKLQPWRCYWQLRMMPWRKYVKLLKAVMTLILFFRPARHNQ